MNNLTIVYLPLFWITLCYLSGSFHLIFLRNFCHLDHFVENKKDGTHLIEQTSFNPIFFPAWFLLNMALHHNEGAQYFSNWWVWDVFLEDFLHMHCSCWEHIRQHRVSDNYLKSQNNNTVVIPPYTTPNFPETSLLG